jgi:hypothetical protein
MSTVTSLPADDPLCSSSVSSVSLWFDYQRIKLTSHLDVKARLLRPSRIDLRPDAPSTLSCLMPNKVLAVLALALSCGRAPEPMAPVAAEAPADLPPTAKVEVWRAMQEDLDAVRHASDGGGRVVLVEGPAEAPVAGGTGQWRFRYEAGPAGIAVGGALIFQVPPFWGWSPPQDVDPAAPGYTEVSTAAEGVGLVLDLPDRGMLRAVVQGRALRAGEQVLVGYGVGEAEAAVDRYTEAREAFWFGVDGDGDGIRALVPNPPTTAVVAGRAQQLVVQVPTTAKPGEAVRLTVAALDGYGNAGPPLEGRFKLISAPALGAPPELVIGPGARAEHTWVVQAPGVYQVAVEGPGELLGVSGPLVVHEDAPPVLWADLQVHTALSDGSGALEDVYAYARDVAALDAVAITDHDHWGMRFLDRDPERWQEVVDAANRWNAPGRFVAFTAFEWTSWLYGHRHVIYAGDGPVISSLDPKTRDPAGLWAALRGQDAVTIAHHVAGGPVAIDWRSAPDPSLEPVVELCSVHGSSESEDTPGRIYSYVPGHGVRDALARGYRLGILCSTDGHDGHPGMAHLQAEGGGLAALLTADRTRAGILAALRARRVYGTNGVRLLLRVRVGEAEMGEVLGVRPDPLAVEVRVVAGTPVLRVELIGADGVLASREPGTPAVRELFELPALPPGAFFYARVQTEGGGAAWSSPIWMPEG